MRANEGLCERHCCVRRGLTPRLGDDASRPEFVPAHRLFPGRLTCGLVVSGGTLHEGISGNILRTGSIPAHHDVPLLAERENRAATPMVVMAGKDILQPLSLP